MKEKGTCGSHLKKKLKAKGRRLTKDAHQAERDSGRERFDFFFLSLLSSQIHGNLTFGFRRVKNEKCSTRRELRVGTKKNTGFHREFR